MKKVLKILVGLILMAGPLYFILPGMSMASWGQAAMTLIKGGITIIVPIIGLALILMGFSQLRE